MSISRKFQRSKSKYTLSQKIISAVTAAGFIMQPIVGFAQSINKVNNNGSIEVNGNVTNIWADKVVSNSAVNVFKDFQLDANNIANMYFNTKGGSGADAANLVNFVNSRIDINGTVNAVKDNKIGGNLFFLSKDGMAVGKSGVINTGSLYVMTPTQDYIKNMKVVAGTADAATAEKELNAITNITKDANAWQAIPVNTSGTITVLGKVNAANEVQMRAAKIGVGKNVDDQVVDEVASGDTVSAASITTGVTNFGDLVNIKGVDGAEDVKSGLTGELTATQTGSGDIVLSAYVDGATKENDLEVLPVVGATLGPIAETAENTFVEQDFNAYVDVYGSVETAGEKGDININATAVNSNADFDEKLNDYKANNNDVAQLANVKAEVNIDGAVKAAEDVTVKAEAINRYIDNSGAFAKANIAIASGTPITGDIAYSVLNTRANVNIASGATVESKNGSVDIDAKAETLAASAASVTALKFKAAGGTTGANVPAVSVLYTGADNKANVTVEGTVTAAENISIDADADMKVDAENKMGIKGKMGNQFVVGVTVAGAENSASVDIKDEDNSNNVINAGNDLSVNANATSDFTSGTSIKAPEASAMAVAVNVTDFNSNAKVNIDTDLTAGNDLTVKADNIITDDNVIAESTIGSGKYVSAATQVVTGHVEQKKGEVKEFISGLAAVLGKGKKLPIGDEDEIPGLQLSEIFKAGATVTYSGQKHDSSVTIGKNASLKANAGKLDIGALTKIEDAHITATGTTSSYNDAYPAELTVNAAVLVNNMDNSSSVVVADRDEGSAEPTLKGKNGVSVNASTRFEYNRIKNMIQDVKEAANQIASAVGGLKGSIKNDFNGFIDTLNKQIDAWESAFKTADETLATSDKGVLAIGEAATAGYNVLTALNNLNTMLDNRGSEVAADTKAAIQGASDLLTSALAFADPNSYGNFAASSASKGSSGDTGSIAGHHSSAVNGAGTVMVNTVNSVSKVEIGSNAVINAVGKVELNAENYMKDVSLGGLNAVPLTNSGGGTAASIGATVNYSDFNTDTVVAVNDGAAISGGDINIAGSNEIDHVSVAGSAGMGPSDETESKGIVLNGMLSFVDGSSDILTVVDDGAELTANAQKQYTETVKDEETGEETEVTKTSEGNISISGHNDTNIVNVAAGLNLGSGSGAVGVGLAYNDFAVKNIAGVADVAEQLKGLYGTGTGDVTFANKYNKETAKDNEGGISAYGFDVDAATEGSIQSVSVAASASKNDDTGEVSFFGKIKGGISNVENDLLGTGGKLDQVTGKIFGTESGKANEMFNKGSSSHGTGGGIKLVGGTSGKGGFMPSFSIAGSGSVSLNVLDNATEAIVDNAKISMNDGNINVTARDALYAGAYSGAAALQWKSGGSSSDKAVGFAGAAGVNDIDNVVKAVVKESTIENAGEFNTMALSGGEQLALGLGLAVEKTGSTSGYSGNAAVSVNLIDHEVEALHENNTVKETEDVNVSAYARDIENTGGGSLGAGQQKVGVGATVGVAMLNNNISAGIKGGSYEKVGNVDVEALNALQNITVGIAAGLTLPSSGSGASAVVEGAGVYNEVHNTTNAFIKGDGENSKAVISTVDGGSVNVTAQDVAIDESSLYEQLLADGLADGKEEIAKRMGSGFDITGASELSGIETGDIEAQLNNKDAEGTGTQSNENSTEEVNLNKDSGSSIITVAGVLAGTSGKGAGGAAVAITDIENTYTADVKYAAITADELDVDAGSNSNIVTVAGGIAAANKGSGVGSVSWNDVINTANVNIANSHIYAQQTTATAANQAQIVSVGGQISGAGKAAVGATISYVGLDNTTKVNISTTEFDERTANEGTSVTAKANNTSDSYNIGAGVSAAGDAAVSGTVVVTQTKGTAGAVMDGAKINNAKEIIAHASDDTDILSVIGTVNIAGKAAVGAGVAYTEIGGVSDDKEKAEQHVTAEIKNSTINTAAEGTKIEVKAEDNSKVTNIAVGVGGALRAAVQGASATTLINKATTAGINNTQIDAPVTDEEGNSTIEGSQKANVTVDAQNNSEITSSADTASVAGQGVAAGAGIAVNRIIQQTNADVNGGVMNVNNLKVNANGTPRIENVGIGIAVAAQGAGATGSVAVNMIQNDVTAHIGSGANIVADGSVGVIATSDEQIATYAGQAAVAGQGAGVGISVAVNEIAGTTSATVGGEKEDTTSVIAKGNDSITTNTLINVEDEINDALIDGDTVGMDAVIDRQEEERSGLIVDASSTRDMKSFLITAGVAGMGAGVAGTVNVNQINGGTNAGITNAEVNDGNTAVVPGNNANVIVNAGDYSNMSGFVGSVGVGGIGAGAGLASDTNTISREVTAKVDSSDIKAQGFEIDADSAQGVSSFGTGVGAAGIGGGAAGVVTVTELNNTTKTMLNNSKVNANTVNIKANHTGIVNAGNVSVGGAGLGVGGGLSVGVLKDNSTTEVTVKGDKSEEDTITASGDVTIAANNNATVNPMISANGVGAFGGVAGATSINNLNSTVKTNIEGVGITSTGGSISGTADNTFNVKAYMGTIGGGAVGAGAGVTVNTIDSSVQTNVNGSALDAAKDIILTAQETRNIEQTATNVAAGGLAVGANIAVTNIGEKITDEDTKKKIEEANTVFGDDAGILTGDAASALATAGIENYTPHVDAELGGGKNSQITVNISGSKLEADNNLTVKATETDNISMTLGSGAAGAAAVNAGVGILNVHRNVGVNITGGGISANKIDIGTDITGSANLEVYQGTAGAIGVNAAVGEASTTGSSKIDIDDVTFAGNDIDITAGDHGNVNVNTLGITVGAVSVGAIVAGAENSGNTEIEITSSEAAAKDTDKQSDISITTDKANTVDAHAIGGAGGAATGQGVVATAKDSGASSITLGAQGQAAEANNFVVNKVNIAASAKPAVKAIADSYAVSILGTAGASVATAEATGNVNVNVYDGNTLSAEDVDITGEAGIQDGKNTAEAKVVGNSGSGYVSVADNAAVANVTTQVKVNVGDVDYKTKTEKVFVGYKDVEGSTTGEREEVYKDVVTGATNLKVSGSNSSKAATDAKGITIGGIFSSGNNQAFTTNEGTTNVSVSGGSAETLLKSLNVTATGTTDNTAKADGSGGGLVSGDLAAYAKNDSQAEVNASLSGSFNVAGDVTVNALQSDTANINADALKATVVGASATLAENNIGGSTNANISNATINGGGKLDVNAANTVTFGNTEQYAVEGSGYGGVNVQGAVFDNTINKNTAVNLNNADITTLGTQALEAKTTGNINAGGYIKAAGLGAFTWVDVNNAVTASDTINIDGSSALTTKQEGADITLAAVDNMDLTVAGYADVQGAAVGGASSDVTNNLVRNNSVTVSGDLYALNDVNLYAGKDKTGANGSLDLVAESETYNYAALPIADPKLDDKFAQNNQIIINSGNDISSVRDINLYADAGKESVRDTTLMYTWVYSDKKENYSNSSVGDAEPNNKSAQNFVQVNGNLTAGVQNKQYVSIGGKYNAETQETNGMQLVFFDDETLKAVHDYGNGQESAVGADGLIVDYSEGVDGNGIEIGTFDYGTTLFDRYNELGELMAGYSEDTSSTAYLGYKAERQRIFEQLQSMNLIKEMTNDKGQKYYVQVEGMTVDYIELPDIVASGGNINIQSDSLSGSGGLTAQGAPEVVINNNTNLYLKINNVTVGEAGGEVNFNNTALTSADGTKYGGITIAPDKESGSGGELVINGNYGGGYVYAQVDLPKDQDSTQSVQQTIQLKPRADIEINGIVNSEEGTVRITSAADNIVIQGESAADSAAVKGKTIVLSASKGSVSQGFQEGIVNIGGSVQTQYDDLYQDAKDHFDNKYGFKHDSVEDEWSTNDAANEPSGNMIAGENVYINASDININGKIQSGYADYVVNIDAGLQDTINQMQQNWQNSGSKPLTDAMVTTGTTYRIVEGKDILQSDGSYYRQLDVYYNPYTGKIVVPDVDANGGQVYLTGRISSTGGGSIKVLDGAYDINVTNNTSTDLQLGKLVSNDVEGLISIADTGTKKVTEFTRNGTVVKDMTQLDENGNYIVVSESGASSQYQPDKDLRYNWTTGQETTTSETYNNTIKAGLWGLVETMDETELKEFEESHKPTEPATESNKNKPNGEYIGSVEGIDSNDNFVVIYENDKFEENRTQPVKVDSWSSGFLGWFKWEKYEWEVTTGTSQQYVASVKADKPISIGFIGNSDGNSNISVTSAGNINLTNNIASASDGTGSLIDINSTGGAINQLGGSLIGDNIDLSAAKGINDVQITSIGDTVNLNAVSSNGDVDVTVNAAYGKAGNVVIDNLFAGTAANPAGDVSLTAYGNITQSGKVTSVSGNRIDLVSANGAIGTDSQAIIVHGGQEIVDATDSLSASVNAQAEVNINLTQDSGDMRIGRVYSDSGNVTITVNSGDLVDALPTGETVDRGDTDELIQKWIDLGLVEGTGDYSKKVEQDVKDYKDGVKNEFKNYLAQKDYYESQTGSVTQEYKDAYNAYSEAKTQYDALNDSFDTWSKGKAYYTESKYVPVRENYKTDEAFNTALAEYKDGKAAFDKLNEQFNGYDTFAEYSEANKVENTYSAYFKPSVTITDEEGNPQAVDLKAEFDGYANYESLKKTYGNYTSAEDYLAGSEAQTHIAELSDSGKTYWDKDKLLYAISDTITNPDSGSTDNVVKDPNIKGNNITINVNGGSAGLNSEEITELKIEGIGDDIENLKLLASADASTVNWNDKTGIITINEKLPIGIQSTGKVDVETNGNVYLSGRTDGEAENVLNIGNINAGTDGNIRLQGQDGIYNLSAGERVAITGKDLLIQAGEGSIGTAGAMMTTNLSGSMQAQASGGIYINQLGTNNLVLDSVGAGQDIVLKSAKDILMSTDMQSGGAVNYIRSDNGTISLEAQNIGAKDNALRILDNGVVVNADATGNIILEGVSGTGSAGELILGTIKGENLDVTSAGNVSIGKDASEDETAVEGSIEVNGDASISAEDGSVTQTADSNITANAVNASATENILLNSHENKVNSFVVNGLGADNSLNGSVELAGSKDSGFAADLNGITVNNGGVTVTNYAENGTLNISGGSVKTTDAEKGSVTFSSEGSITSDATVNSAANINMNADGAIANDGSLTAQNNVNVDTTAGAIELGGSVTANTGNVNVETDSGTITTTGNVTGDEKVIINSGEGDVTVNGNVTATNQEVKVTTGSGSITTTGNISGGTEVNVHSDNGAINIGDASGNGIVNAGTNVNVTTDSGAITTTGAITGGSNVIVDAGTLGNVSLGGSVTAKTGNVNVETDSGTITTTGNVTGDEKVIINSGEGDVTVNGDVTATNEEVTVTTGGGDITTTGTISGNTDVKVDAGTSGSIDLGGSVTAKTGNVNVETDSGTIITTGNVTGGNDVNVTSGSGAINLGGNVEAETGLVNVTTGSGSITTTGNVSGHKDVTLESVDGNITVGGYTESEVENVTANVKGDGNIEFTGEVSANGDVQAEVTGEGDISTGSSASVSGTDITFTTNDGSITTGSSLTADKNIQLTTNTGNITTGADLKANENVDLNVNTGNITFGGDVNAGSENAENGNITIDITNGGSIKDAENKDNKLTAIGSGGSETAGNIIITTGGAGDVDLYDLYATNAARIDIADGSLTLHEINGELVAMQLRTEGKDMNVENIVAGTQIVLTGSDMTLDQISQRPDADGMLVITPDNAEADKPIDNFTIGDIKTNSDSGIRFDRLWVNNSDIHISEGQLWFDKLYVEDNAHFSNDEMTAAIYGKPPLRDGSDSVYWINTEENRPESSLDMWLNGTGDWMYLRFTDDHIQESNGILLTLDEYDYVYDQRFTAENHLRWQHGRYLDEDWKQAYGYGLSLHNRYGLIDYQEFTETNAGADEVAVEA